MDPLVVVVVRQARILTTSWSSRKRMAIRCG